MPAGNTSRGSELSLAVELVRKAWRAWNGMRCRCRPGGGHPHYGGRGIRVAPEWEGSFLAFLRDVGLPTSLKHSIDRFPNNNGDYEPDNVRWATAKQQSRNKRNTVYVLYQGQERPLVEVCE